MESPVDVEMVSGPEVKVDVKVNATKGRRVLKELAGGDASNVPDGRYSGEAGIFESLEDEANEAAHDPSDPLKSIEGWIIVVTGVHEECTEDDIFQHFEDYGEIKNLHLNLDRRTGFVKGYTLIEYEHYKEAKAAIEGMNGCEVCGMKVNVAWAFTKSDTKRGRREVAG